MPMLRRAFLLLSILGAVSLTGRAQAGRFARHPTMLADIYGSPRPMTVTAPDGHNRAIARFSQWRAKDEDDHLTVFLGGDDHRFPGGPKAELLWAPDSRAIAVTANDGGAEGGFALSILVRRPKGHHWRRIDLTERVAKLFAPQMRCDGEELPNVGAVGWTSGHRLIVAAQVPAHSRCRAMRHIAAYIVDVPSGDVLMEVDRQTLRRRYRAKLGSAFSNGAGHRRHRRHVA